MGKYYVGKLGGKMKRLERTKKSSWFIIIAAIVLTGMIAVIAFGCGDNGSDQTSSTSEQSSGASEQTSSTEQTDQAAAQANNFPQEDITFVIPTSPGGGYDTIARILAPYLEKHLPNSPNVTIKNVPGGQWSIGINEVYNAEPDGYTIGFFNVPGNAVGQVLGVVDYDLTKISWVGRVATTHYVGALSPKSEYSSLEDMQAADEIKVGVVGLSSTGGLMTIVALDAMGVNNKVIPHDGSADAMLAAIRGDIDYVQFPYGSLREYIHESNELTPLVVLAPERIEEMPDVPTAGDLGYPELADKAAMHRMIGTTPGTPEDVLQVLRDSFWEAVNDEEFVAEMKKQGRAASPAKGEKATELAQDSINEIGKYRAVLEEARK